VRFRHVHQKLLDVMNVSSIFKSDIFCIFKKMILLIHQIPRNSNLKIVIVTNSLSRNIFKIVLIDCLLYIVDVVDI
jgi:hypothetical protein